jgi:glycosyltransferase involved in cell wall biosynthesis
MKEKLNIYGFSDNSGVGFYRIQSPLRMAKELGLANIKTSDWRWGLEDNKILFPTMDELLEIGKWADVIFFQRHDQAKYISSFLGLAEHFNIPVIMDTDDNIEAVRPYNPGYRGYHPKSEALIYGKKMDELVFAMTCSTKNLVQWHKNKNKCPYIYELPNSLNLSLRDFKSEKEKNGKINIGWIVSGGHYENYKIIEQPVIDILEKYPQVVFHCMAMYGKEIWGKNVPDKIKKRIKRVDWVPFKNWPKHLASLNLDIGLAPLKDNLFNRAKSNLRWMEYSANETASIVSPVEAYRNVKNGVTGLKCQESSEWFDAMERLILDKKLRQKIGKEAKKEVVAKYNMRKNARLWVDTIEKVVKQYRKTNGHHRM